MTVTTTDPLTPERAAATPRGPADAFEGPLGAQLQAQLVGHWVQALIETPLEVARNNGQTDPSRVSFAEQLRICHRLLDDADCPRDLVLAMLYRLPQKRLRYIALLHSATSPAVFRAVCEQNPATREGLLQILATGQAQTPVVALEMVSGESLEQLLLSSSLRVAEHVSLEACVTRVLRAPSSTENAWAVLATRFGSISPASQERLLGSLPAFEPGCERWADDLARHLVSTALPDSVVARFVVLGTRQGGEHVLARMAKHTPVASLSLAARAALLRHPDKETRIQIGQAFLPPTPTPAAPPEPVVPVPAPPRSPRTLLGRFF